MEELLGSWWFILEAGQVGGCRLAESAPSRVDLERPASLFLLNRERMTGEFDGVAVSASKLRPWLGNR